MAYDFVKIVSHVLVAVLSLSNATNPPTLTTTLNPTLVPKLHLRSCTMSTAGSSTTMAVAELALQMIPPIPRLMKLSSAISTRPRHHGPLVAGNGGLDTGSITTNSTWYHFFEIERMSILGVVDVIFSTKRGQRRHFQLTTRFTDVLVQEKQMARLSGKNSIRMEILFFGQICRDSITARQILVRRQSQLPARMASQRVSEWRGYSICRSTTPPLR
jgi:hypothetical protein